jgi:hypothetical protein
VKRLLGFALVAVSACSLVYAGDLDDASNATGEPRVDGGNDTGTSTDAIADVISTPDADATTAVYASRVLADQPLAYWRLEDAPGSTTLHDEVGEHDLVVIRPNELTFGVAGVAGSRAIKTTGEAELQAIDLVHLGDNAPFTIEAWVRPTFTGDRYGLVWEKNEFRENEIREGVFLWINPGREMACACEVWDGTKIITAAGCPVTLPKDRFVHFVAVGDGALRLYIDGELFYGGQHLFPDPSNRLTFGDSMVGDFDELAVYDKALTEAQVKAHFEAGRP